MKIVLLEPIGINTKELNQIKADFNALNHEFVSYDTRPSNDEEILKKVVDSDAFILSNLPISENIIESCKNLKMISVAFAGVDHIPVDLCTQKNILVSNAAGYSNHAVAELTIGSAINLLRKINWGNQQTRNGLNREGFLGGELYGKTFGIIGLGQIGKEVAHLANAFGCKVLAHNRSSKNVPNVEFCSLEYLLKTSDVISLHVPLAKETKHLIRENEIHLMKETSILINTARGPIVDYKFLSKALNNKKIAGAAIDVYEKEPPLEKDHVLFDAPNTILLPHIGYATKEAIELRGKIVIENIKKWLNGKPQNMMN